MALFQGYLPLQLLWHFILFIYLFLVGLGFELRALSLQNRRSTP
jgi:hypothetical protein